jgi:hypothetical protein
MSHTPELPNTPNGEQFLSDLGTLARLAQELSILEIDSQKILVELVHNYGAVDGKVGVLIEAKKQAVDLDKKRTELEGLYLGRTAVIDVLDTSADPIWLNRVTNNIYNYARPPELDFRTPWKVYRKNTLKGSVGHLLNDGSFRIDKLPTVFSRFSESFYKVAFQGTLGNTDVRDNYQVFPLDRDGNTVVTVTFVD